eukprot:c19711_g1_i2.p1 GENE.c19711_g1_i2~~c19711_g1_i2.p1  ORF type:complete len:702 (+),score=238.22 c19711_g1_i2:81-2186(+)
MLRFSRNSSSSLECLAVVSQRGNSTIASYKDKKTFDKILIANRGEIAIRVMKTAKAMGIKTVAVYSDADANSKHAKFADEAYNIGPAPSNQSYLVQEKILDVVKKSGAQAVHPGYGFLSEKYFFSRALRDMGVKFIGPGEAPLKCMGDKVESKQIARNAGVNTIPGFAGILKTAEDAVKAAHEIGYPVMVKASGGGGGKGMRIAWNDKETIEAFRLCSSEALSSFNDDRMFVEKFIEDPRHIEIQILVDQHGSALYFPERECSIQRRNQKVIEEAPSVLLDPKTREAMGKQAIQLAKAVGYENAGTVEFLCDKHKNFYFLEMNTRLQVEHPITEMITQQDLVCHMIHIAAGHPLSVQQSDLKIVGHAVECRVYAEDPYRGFLPSIGRLSKYKEPSIARCDSGILEGTEISPFYDPMVSKTITYAPTRAEALEKMRHALDSYVIQGVGHNISLLRAVLDHKRFIDGTKISTKFLAEEYPEGFKGYHIDVPLSQKFAAVVFFIHTSLEERDYSVSGKKPPSHRRMYFELDEYNYWIGHSNKTDGKFQRYDIFESEDSTTPLATFGFTSDWKVGERVIKTEFEDGSVEHTQLIEVLPTGYKVSLKGSDKKVKFLNPISKKLLKHMPVLKKIDTSKFVLSPMPGLVKSVAVQPGDKVIVGQEVAVIEAMKMQNVIRSEKDAVIKSVLVKTGSSVHVDEILIEFEA